jgi:hypothetical protein
MVSTAIAVAVIATLTPSASAPARTYVPCERSDGDGAALKRKPRRCTLGGPAHYQQAPLIKLHWSRWGRRGARGRGRFIYNMGFNEAATVRLSRAGQWDKNTFVFSRARVCVHGHGCHIVKLPVA